MVGCEGTGEGVVVVVGEDLAGFEGEHYRCGVRFARCLEWVFDGGLELGVIWQILLLQ